MTTETTVISDVNTETAPSGDIDTQLAEMQTAEKPEASQPEAKEATAAPKETAAPEVKKVVPLAALHEERRARQELQRQMQVINERLEILTAPPKKQAPNPAEDGVGYIDHKIEQLTQTIQPLVQNQQQDREARQQEQMRTQLINTAVNHRVEFEKTTPDLPQAGLYLNDVRTRELVALGMPETEARRHAEKELDNATLQWTANGQNPAQVAYQFALARGYQAKAAEPTPQEKIAAQQKGTAAARSLGGGGAVNAGKLTAEALASMSNEDFAKLSESDWRKAMGG